MENNKILSNAFAWLFVGLIICFGVSYITSFEDVVMKVYGFCGGYGYLIFAIAELVVAIVLSVRITKLNPLTAKILYLLYTVLTGLSLTGLFFIYELGSLTFVFLITAILFGIFAIIGKTTKIDLSKWYIYLFVGLLAIIILQIVNMFLLNNTLNIILCIVSVVIFCAYVAYDINIALNKSFLADCENKGIYVAFNLFLDFINIFLDLLRLFGKARD